jgi:hypothetical protein
VFKRIYMCDRFVENRWCDVCGCKITVIVKYDSKNFTGKNHKIINNVLRIPIQYLDEYPGIIFVNDVSTRNDLLSPLRLLLDTP